MIDHAVTVIYLIAVFLIGWFSRKRRDRPGDLFSAGRAMGPVAVGLSLMVTSFSALNVLAFPTEIYSHGLYVLIALPAFFIVGVPVTRLVIPRVVKSSHMSIYDYFTDRYDKRVTVLASVFFLLWRTMWMAVILYACGRLLAVVSGFGIVAGIWIAGAVAVAYTAVGGLRAVMLTDILQFCVVLAAFLFFCHAGLSDPSANVFEEVASVGGLKPFYPFDPEFLSINPTVRITVWSGLIGVFFAFTARYGADQVVTQRYRAASSLSVAKRGYWLGAVSSVIVIALTGFAGLLAKAHAVQNGLVGSGIPPLKIIADMAGEMPAGVHGLLTAALMAATMSSLDSGVNAAGSVFFSTVSFKEMSHARVRCFSLFIGVFVTALATVFVKVLGPDQSLFRMMNQIINGMGTPLLALFFVSRYFRRVSAPAVMTGGIFGVAGSICIILFVKDLALHYYAVANFAVTVLFCLFFSLFTFRGGKG